MLERVKNSVKKILRPEGNPHSLSPLPPYGYFAKEGLTWKEIKQTCTGYDSQAIIEKVRSALVQVKNGSAVYERDSVLFDEIQYAWPLLSCLLLAAQKTGRVHVIDFGGSLGSTYFQNKKFLDEIAEVSWNVIEQKHFVEIGQKELAGDRLHFYESIEACRAEQEIDVLIVSSTLQYLPEPWKMLQSFLSQQFPFVIFDRTTFNEKPADLMVKQIVPPVIYDASYPACFLNKERFLKEAGSQYRILEQWDALSGQVQIYQPDGSTLRGEDRGFFFVRK